MAENKIALKTKLKLIMLVAAVILAVIFIWQNRQDATATFLFAKLTMPMAVFLMISLAIGFVMGIGATALMARKKK